MNILYYKSLYDIPTVINNNKKKKKKKKKKKNKIKNKK